MNATKMIARLSFYKWRPQPLDLNRSEFNLYFHKGLQFVKTESYM